MDNRTFVVHACWDDEAQIFYSDSTIVGLHIEAETLDEFEEVLFREAPILIVENHISKPDMAKKSLMDLIPAIVWNRPKPQEADCGHVALA